MSTIALTRIAVSTSISTKVAAKSALKNAGLKQVLCDALLAEVERISKLRSRRKFTRIERKLGRELTQNEVVALRDTCFFQSGNITTPAYRLSYVRICEIQAVARRLIQIGVNDTLGINLTQDPAKIGLVQTACVDWNKYGGKFKGRPCNYWANTVTVPRDWRVRVQRKKLASVDGLFTLDAAPLEGAPDGVEIFAASWLVKGRGNTASVVKGYIARSQNLTYHGETSQKALIGLKRKIKAAEWDACLQSVDLSELVAKYPTVVVRVSDAKAIGACDYGIRSWCNSVSLNYEAGHAALSEVYEAYTKEPRSEARAAILHALRKIRNSK